MTPRWHDGALDALRPTADPVVWSAPDADAGADARRRRAAALVARLAGVAEREVVLARDPAGAPYVARPHGWYVGLARGGGRCLVGVATCPVAVDREPVDDLPPLWDMLSADEARDLARMDAARQPRAWLRRWTIKEAHAKLVGEPRRLAPETIETRVIDAVRATATCEGVSRCWTREAGGGVETVALWDARV